MSTIDREKVISHLQNIRTWNVDNAEYSLIQQSRIQAVQTVEWIDETLDMLKVAYTPEEAWCVLVSHGQQDKRFKWGEVIKYSPSEVQEILEEARPMKHADADPVIKWISAQKPPKAEGLYLVCVADSDFPSLDYFAKGRWCICSVTHKEVTHWMPLPEMPEEVMQNEID